MRRPLHYEEAAVLEHHRDDLLFAFVLETKPPVYAAKMSLALQAWDRNNLERLSQLLEETAADPNRGFEWRYWEHLIHLADQTFYGSLNAVQTVAFSADGRRIASGDYDRTGRVWDLDDEREPLLRVDVCRTTERTGLP